MTEGLNRRIDGPADAPVLVLSNSLGTDLALWDEQMPALTNRFRVLRYDTRGHGTSPVIAGACTVEMLGLDVLTLLDALRVKRAHFCGLSLGGMTGIWLGVHAAERIDRLLLANTAPQLGSAQTWNTRIDAVRRVGMEAVADAVVERWFTAGFRARAPQTVRRVRAMLAATSPEGYIACCGAVRDADLWPDIASIRAHTLVITGTHDVVATPAEDQKMAARIAGARYAELDAAHISNIEAAARFTAEAIRFLGA